MILKFSDIRDVLVFVLVSAAWIVATIFLFKHATDFNFATWAALCATITSAYHWIIMKDDKQTDAGG